MDAQGLFDTRWAEHCVNFRVNVAEQNDIVPLVETLNALTQILARDDAARVQLALNDSLWNDLQRLWYDLAQEQLISQDNNGDNSKMHGREKDLRVICGSLAKFTRNLVAGVPGNQLKAHVSEPHIRRLLHYHTSWTASQEKESVMVARLLTQTLSNMVTANEELMMGLWETYMKLPEDEVVLIRLLQSPDPGTLLTVLIFILNCIHKSKKRSTMMCETPVGCRVCITLLDDMLKLFEAEELTQGAQAFDVGYDILSQLIEHELVPDLYAKFSIPDEIVTPHQTTLLKIVDSYLQSVQLNTTSATPKTIAIHNNLSPTLATCFFDLSRYAQEAIRMALRQPVTAEHDIPSYTPKSGETRETNHSTDSSAIVLLQVPPTELDVMLPTVCEALVLITQCIVTITLGTERRASHDNESDFRAFFDEIRSGYGIGMVQSLIELLRQLDIFLPRVNFGKPVTNKMQLAEPASEVSGFEYLKRDLVRLLGILCHGSKAVQDEVREYGGIEVVANLCAIDERNPYLREYAIFTLHNLLKGNPENQAVVESIKPMREWDEQGILRDTPGATRR